MGCCTACCGSGPHRRTFWSRCRTSTRSPSSHRGPEAAGWTSRCSGPWSTTKIIPQTGRKVITLWFSLTSFHQRTPRCYYCTSTSEFKTFFLPFLVRTPSRPPEDLFWSYKSTGCRGGCTTVACRGRRSETIKQEMAIKKTKISKQMPLLYIYCISYWRQRNSPLSHQNSKVSPKIWGESITGVTTNCCSLLYS